MTDYQQQLQDAMSNTGLTLFSLSIAILTIVAWWVLFKKANEPGWAAIVPFLDTYKLFKISWGNGWLFLLLFIPIVNIVIQIIMCVKLSKAFGHGGGFACGLIFLNTIFIYILAFGSSEYIGPNGESVPGSGYNLNEGASGHQDYEHMD